MRTNVATNSLTHRRLQVNYLFKYEGFMPDALQV